MADDCASGRPSLRVTTSRGLSSSGYRWRNRRVVASGCHELDEARGPRGGPWPSAQPSIQTRDVQGGSGRDMLQVGLSEADVARAAQAAEPNALRQAALNPGATHEIFVGRS